MPRNPSVYDDPVESAASDTLSNEANLEIITLGAVVMDPDVSTEADTIT